MDTHQVNFFGKNSAFILSANNKTEAFIMLKFIKRKPDNNWERLNEGKAVKINLKEMIYILAVLERKVPSFSTVHKFKEEITKISFKWDDIDSNLMWINVADYSRSLLFPETELLMKLMDHLVTEKIEYATANNWSDNNVGPSEDDYIEDPIPIPVSKAQNPKLIQSRMNSTQNRTQNQINSPISKTFNGNSQALSGNHVKTIQQSNTIQSNKATQNINSNHTNSIHNSNSTGSFGVNINKSTKIPSENEFGIENQNKAKPDSSRSNSDFGNNVGKNSDGNGRIEVIGKIKINRPKAVLISLNEYGDFWIPKSAIANEFDENSDSDQKFLINEWCLNKPNATSIQS